MPVEYVRRPTDAEARERARAHVTGQARRGESPSTFDPADLAWAFAGLEAALVELEQEAEQVREAQRERERAKPRQRDLERMTATVLKEWDAAAKAERLAKVDAEARKRLGWDKT